MNIKLIKKNGKAYVQLPEEFNSLDEADILKLRADLWIIAAPAGAKKPEEKSKPEGKTLAPPEKSVLQKLMGIRFAERTPPNIEKTFTSAEKDTVRQLIKEGFIQVFYGKKYEKTGVYNISRDIFPLIGHEEQQEPQPARASAPASAPAQQEKSQPQAQQALPTYSELSKNGWLIIPGQRDAEQFSYDLKKSGLSQNVKGVRGFDGKFYVATNKFLYAAYEKIKAVLEKKKEMHLIEIAEAAAMDADAVSVVMHLVAESGEVIEKKRGLYCLA